MFQQLGNRSRILLGALGVIVLYLVFASRSHAPALIAITPEHHNTSTTTSNTTTSAPSNVLATAAPTTVPKACTTNELGPERNKSCVFPFIYRGEKVNHCLGTFFDDGKEEEVGAWCATTSDFDKDQKWGYCGACDGSLPEKNELTLCPSPPNSSWCVNYPKVGTQACYYLGGLTHYCDETKMKALWEKPRQCKKDNYTIQLINIAYGYMDIVKTGDVVECPCRCSFINGGNKPNPSSDLVMTDILNVPGNFRQDHSHAIRVGMYTESPILHPSLMQAGGVSMFNYDGGYGPVTEDVASWFRIALYPQEEMLADARPLLHIPPLPWALKKNQSEVMSTWISNCGLEATGRNGVGQALQDRGIKLASFGACLGGPKSQNPKEFFVKLFADLEKTHPGVYTPYQSLINNFGRRYPDKILTSSLYLFAASFENSDCDWYHTEKPYQALFAGVIPVYIGAKTIHQRLPKGSFIHVRDFKDADELAQLLTSIANNETKYNEYMAWRNKPMASSIYSYFTEAMQYPMGAPIRRRYLCEMCEILDKVYGMKHKDMLPDNKCERGAWKQ